MSESKIEWTESTWEVTAGCKMVSSGCANCYAEKLVSTRFYGMAKTRKRDGTANGSPLDLSLKVIDPNTKKWNGHIELLSMNLEQPLKCKKPTVYFVNSRSDLFHPDVPFAYIDRVFAVMALCPRHRFQVLTKRPERMAEYLKSRKPPEHGMIPRAIMDVLNDSSEGQNMTSRFRSHNDDRISWPLNRVWLGTSVEDQDQLKRAWDLLKCPAAGRFLSCEPLLGPLDLDALELLLKEWRRSLTIGIYLDWIIVGGESGPGHRPCEIAWIRSIVEQCKSAGVPVFVKQDSGHKAGMQGRIPDDLWIKEVPDGLRSEAHG